MHDNDPEVVADLKGPVLNLGSPASALAPALLELMQNVLWQDVHYIERVKRHYQMFRQRIDGARLGGVTAAQRKSSQRNRRTSPTSRNRRR